MSQVGYLLGQIESPDNVSQEALRCFWWGWVFTGLPVSVGSQRDPGAKARTYCLACLAKVKPVPSAWN